MSVAPGDRCLVAVMPTTGELHSVQALPRLTGRIHSRPSASVGQIAPDQEHLAMCGGNCFVRVSQVTGAQQLPAVGERVEFHLMPNPERADRLWAAEVAAGRADSPAQPIAAHGRGDGRGHGGKRTASQPTARLKPPTPRRSAPSILVDASMSADHAEAMWRPEPPTASSCTVAMRRGELSARGRRRVRPAGERERRRRCSSSPRRRTVLAAWTRWSTHGATVWATLRRR